ncbi:uncharacterized protein LOC134338968 [Mobula hypostoma]|uniref:uncharacterized protein LOC134338968 n=1 Tax=Mobula hypostoma TaxID=723540 RepID=UPI002FC3627C
MWSAVSRAVESLMERLGAELDVGRTPERERTAQTTETAVTVGRRPEEPGAGRVTSPAVAGAVRPLPVPDSPPHRRKKRVKPGTQSSHRVGSPHKQPGAALSEDELDAYHELFLLLSEPPDHRAISARSLCSALRTPLPAGPLRQLLRQMDSDADGAVGFTDFVRFAGDASLYLGYVAQLSGAISSRTGDPALLYRVLSEVLRLGRLSTQSAGHIVRYYHRRMRAGFGPEGRRGDAASPKFMGVSSQRLALYLDARGPSDGSADGPLTQEQVSAFREFYELFDRNCRDNIDSVSILGITSALRLRSGNALVPSPLQFLAASDGEEVSFPDFLRLLTSAETFQRFLGQEKEEGGAVCEQPRPWEALSPDALFFNAVANIVRGPWLSAKAADTLVRYYHRMFREAVCQPRDLSRAEPAAARSRSRPSGHDSPTAPSSETRSRRRRRRRSRQGRLQAYEHEFRKALRNPIFVLVFNEYSWTLKREQRERGRRLDGPKKRTPTGK